MKHLYKMLTELGADPFMQQDFLDDPEPFIAQAQLGPDERAALDGRGDEQLIAGGDWTRCAMIGDPGPDDFPDPDPPLMPL